MKQETFYERFVRELKDAGAVIINPSNKPGGEYIYIHDIVYDMYNPIDRMIYTSDVYSDPIIIKGDWIKDPEGHPVMSESIQVFNRSTDFYKEYIQQGLGHFNRAQSAICVSFSDMIDLFEENVINVINIVAKKAQNNADKGISLDTIINIIANEVDNTGYISLLHKINHADNEFYYNKLIVNVRSFIPMKTLVTTLFAVASFSKPFLAIDPAKPFAEVMGKVNNLCLKYIFSDLYLAMILNSLKKVVPAFPENTGEIFYSTSVLSNFDIPRLMHILGIPSKIYTKNPIYAKLNAYLEYGTGNITKEQLEETLKTINANDKAVKEMATKTIEEHQKELYNKIKVASVSYSSFSSFNSGVPGTAGTTIIPTTVNTIFNDPNIIIQPDPNDDQPTAIANIFDGPQGTNGPEPA